LIMADNPERAVGFKEIIGIASCAFGLGLVYFGYGKRNAARTRAERSREQAPVRGLSVVNP